MNYIPKIAEMLGLEDGDAFDAVYVYEDLQTKYRVLYDGEFKFINGTAGYYIAGVIYDILCGKAKMVKKPWKPRGEEYWVYDPESEIAVSYYFHGFARDYAYWKVGNCFRTKEEAEIKGKEIMDKIMKEYK